MPKSLKRISLFSALVVLGSIIIPIAVKSESALATGITITAPSSINISGAGGPVCPGTPKTGCPMRVSGLSSNNYLVALKIENSGQDRSQLTITSQGSIELSYGYGSGDLNAFTEISFTGTATSVNAALSHLEYISNGFNGEASLTITATENVAGIAYYAKDDHFYKVGHFGVGNVDEGKFCSPSDSSALSYISAYAPIETLTNNFGNGDALGWASKLTNPLIAWDEYGGDHSSEIGLGNLASRTNQLLDVYYRNSQGSVEHVFNSDDGFGNLSLQTPLTDGYGQSLLKVNPADQSLSFLDDIYIGSQGTNKLTSLENIFSISGLKSEWVYVDDYQYQYPLLHFDQTSQATEYFPIYGSTDPDNISDQNTFHLFRDNIGIVEANFQDYSNGSNLYMADGSQFERYRDVQADGYSYQVPNEIFIAGDSETSSGHFLRLNPQEGNFWGLFDSKDGSRKPVFNGDPRFTLNDLISSYVLTPVSPTSTTGNPNCSWSHANVIAKSKSLKGKNGYLANITTSEENAFLRNKLQGALNVWMGGTDGKCDGSHTAKGFIQGLDRASVTDVTTLCNANVGSDFGTEGIYRWYDGPEKGKVFYRTLGDGVNECLGYDPNSGSTQSTNVENRYSNWAAPYEPNNNSYYTSAFINKNAECSEALQQGEDNIVFNWTSPDGRWNDLNGDEPTIPFYGYIIEFGDSGAWEGVASKEVSINGTVARSWTITSSSGSNGNISVSGETTVTEGDDQDYVFTATSGYRIKQVTVDGQSQGRITSYRFTNVQGDHTISVEFERVQAPPSDPVTPTPTPSPTLSPTPTPSPSPSTSETPSSKPTPKPSSSRSNQRGISVPDGTVIITPTQIAELNLRKSATGNSANISISQLKSGQRVRVTVISKANLNTKVVNLTTVGIIKVTPGPIKPKASVNPAMIDIKPAPKAKKSDPSKAKISISGAKKNQRVRVTVKSK